jgi:hypothetical protein
MCSIENQHVNIMKLIEKLIFITAFKVRMNIYHDVIFFTGSKYCEYLKKNRFASFKGIVLPQRLKCIGTKEKYSKYNITRHITSH